MYSERGVASPNFRALAAFLWAFNGLLLQALDPDLAVSQYAKKHWQVEDGLPQNYVTWITQTSDGYLLVGTSGGAAKFDGLRFTPIVLDEKTGISREWINVVQPSADESIWIASRDAGFFLERRQRMRWPEFSVSHLIRLRDGTMLGLGTRGLHEWSFDGTHRVIDATLRSADPAWQGLLELNDGSILAATSRGPLRVTRSGRSSVPAEAKDGLLSLAPGASGFWMGTTKGLFHGALGKQPVPIANVPGPVVSIVEDREGNVWAATWGHGLYRVSKGQHKAVKCVDGVPDDFVHSLFEDREGSLWIGSRAGLSRWSSGPIAPFGPEEGLAGRFFSAAIGDGNAMWFGTWRSGLYRRSNDGTVEKIALPAPDLNFLVRAMAAGKDGSLWLSDWNRLHRYDGRRWNPVQLGGTVAQPQTVAVDAAGGLWVGSANGLFHYAHGVARADATPLLRHRVQTIYTSSSGVWAGTEQGLWRMDEQRATRIEGLPHPSVISVQEDSRQRLWCTTKANGIVLVKEGRTSVLDQRHGLPPHPFYAVIDDGHGSLWLSSPAGIFELNVAQVDAVLAGKAPRLTAVTYDQDDGMRSIECQNVGRPAAWKDPSGDLWFPTVRGMIRVRPSAKRVLPPPHVVIEAVNADGQGHSVRFTSTRLHSPGHVEFRYRIGTQAWIETGRSHEFRYAALPAGTHRVQITARHNGSEWGEAAIAELVQPPRYYETWGFRIGVVIVVAAMLWGIYRWRVYLLRGRYRAVLLERNRISREWHDTLVAGFSAISWQLDTALKRLHNRQSAEDTIVVARTMVHHYRAEARRVIWDLRQNEPEIESLPHAVERALSDLTRDRGVEWELKVEGEAQPVSGDMNQNLLRICQESVNNVIQHAHASKIVVRLRFDESAVSARVEDNGAGFHPDAVPPGHFGLTIMRERAKRFGGDLQVESAPGRGTVVSASLPYENVS